MLFILWALLILSKLAKPKKFWLNWWFFNWAHNTIRVNCENILCLVQHLKVDLSRLWPRTVSKDFFCNNVQYMIKWLIHLPRLSFDTSLHKPVSGEYNLSTIFEMKKGQKSLKLLMTLVNGYDKSYWNQESFIHEIVHVRSWIKSPFYLIRSTSLLCTKV